MKHRPPGLLLSQAIDGFLKYKVVEGLSTRTIDSYRVQLIRLHEHLTDILITDINTLHIEDFLYWLRTEYVPERITGKEKTSLHQDALQLLGNTQVVLQLGPSTAVY